MCVIWLRYVHDTIHVDIYLPWCSTYLCVQLCIHTHLSRRNTQTHAYITVFKCSPKSLESSWPMLLDMKFKMNKKILISHIMHRQISIHQNYSPKFSLSVVSIKSSWPSRSPLIFFCLCVCVCVCNRSISIRLYLCKIL